jgi:DNA mismatch repair protein MutS2
LLPNPDLLFFEANCRVDVVLLERALVFGFSAGDTNRAFERAVDNARCPASSFRADAFARDLFIDEFLAKCFKIRIEGKSYAPSKVYLQRVLCSPVTDEAIVHQRQQVLRQLLGEPIHRDCVEKLYESLVAFRDTLSSGDFSARVDPNVRRLEILRQFAAIIRHMTQFRGASSALARLAAFADHVSASRGFVFLEDLLRYEENYAHVDVRLQLGSDGAVRHFEVLSNTTHPSPLGTHWLGRVWRRLVVMAKGYRVTENEVLSRLIFSAFEGIREVVPVLFQVIGDLEFYLGAIHFCETSASRGRPLAFPTLLDPAAGEPTTLLGLVNPFLVFEGVHTVPTDVTAHPSSITVLTGPNSGGKTRLMQAIALTQLLAQAGLPVSAERARVNRTQGLFVSMFEEVRADQPEGRLGMELLRIRRLFEEIRPGDVIILDELCSGTNPSEGEEIFQLVIELIAQLEPQVWISTHFLQFAQSLERQQCERPPGHNPMLCFLRVCLDENEHPTYRFEPGVAQTSLAHRTAARLGVTRDELQRLVALAKQRPARVDAAS